MKNSIALKLNIPILLSCLILLSVMVLIIKFQTQQLIHQDIKNEAENIIDFIGIGSEADTSTANLIRLTNSMAASKFINGLFIIDSESSIILAATDNKYINKNAAAIEIAEIQMLLTKSNETRAKNPHPLRIKEGYNFLATAYILNEKQNGMKLVNIILMYNAEPATAIGAEFMLNSAIIGGILTIAAFLVIWLLQQRLLLKPISEMVTILNEQNISHKPVLFPIRSSDELGTLAHQYNELAKINFDAKQKLIEALDKAESGNQAKIEFLSNISHELRTPMNSIIGFTNRILKKSPTELCRKDLEAIKIVNKNAYQLLNLINNILDLSKIDALKLELNLSKINLRACLDEVRKEMEPIAEQKSLAVNLQPSDQDIYITADPIRIKQVLINIVSNAIKYTNKGQIDIRYFQDLDCEKDQIVIEIEDTGIGIRNEDQIRLFKRFEQFDENSRFQVGFGTGIGLSLALEFVRLHGGILNVQSTFGKGSIFRIYLPVHGPAISSQYEELQKIRSA